MRDLTYKVCFNSTVSVRNIFHDDDDDDNNNNNNNNLLQGLGRDIHIE